jgi:hypothetical protein
VIFNTTIVEDGRQLLVSTVQFSPRASPSAAGSTTATDSNCDSTLQDVYGRYGPVDLDAVTAARLSATFPFVTPASRAVVGDAGHHNPDVPAWHIADGGFYDNPAIVPAVVWIRDVLQDKSLAQSIAKILVIQIDPFTQTERRPPYDSLKAPGGRGEGPGQAIGWPLQTLAAVRSSSQVTRSLLELDLLENAARSVQIERIVFCPEAYPADYRPPLSWQLTREDREVLESIWKKARESPGYRVLERTFSESRTGPQ